MRPVKKIGLWGVTRFAQLEGIPLLGGYGGSAEGLWSAYSTIMGGGGSGANPPAQKRPLPIEGDKPVRALFMKFHFIPHWQPFKQWLWGNVPPRMSNNGQDQQLFCAANTLIKRVKIFLPESIKGRSMKDTCKQEQRAAINKGVLSEGHHLCQRAQSLPSSRSFKSSSTKYLVLIRQFILQSWNPIIDFYTAAWSCISS